MRKIILALVLTSLSISPSVAQKFGKKGGVGSTDTTYQNGEPSGGTYSIDGVTGKAIFKSAVLASPLTPDSGGTGATNSVDATKNLQFKNNGTNTLPVSVSTRLQNGQIYATDYMTPSQIIDGTSRTDSVDVAPAINTCIKDAVATGKSCYLPGGKWKASSVPILVDYGPNVNSGASFVGEGVVSTTIDLTANTAAVPFFVTASGGTAQSALSTTYGNIGNFALQGNVAGPVLQLGKADQSDQLNQMNFTNISIQNFNTSSSSTCGMFNSLYSSTFTSINCASAAGPNNTNNLWVITNTSFSTFTAFGGSNGGNEIYFTGGTSTGNTFVSWDCEVVTNCLLIDSPNAVSNTWQGGTWSYNWGTRTGYGVVETAGGNNTATYPNLNVSTAGGNTSFLSNGSNLYFSQTDNSTLVTLKANNTFLGNNNFTGTDSFFGKPVFNAGLVSNGLKLATTTYSALPVCNATVNGTIAYINDASVAITAWHQQVSAGGGNNKTFLLCVSSGWVSF